MSPSPDHPPEFYEINKAHPVNSGRHDLYEEALRLVGGRSQKHELAELVCWLLLREDRMRAANVELLQVLSEYHTAVNDFRDKLLEPADRAARGVTFANSLARGEQDEAVRSRTKGARG